MEIQSAATAKPTAEASDPLRGLTTREAQERLRSDGYNELTRGRQRSVLRIAIDVVKEPMFAFLLISGAIYLILGDYTEGLLLFAFASLSVVITIVQETRSERTLAALRDLSSPRSLVIRDGVRRRIASRDIVRGDIILLSEGDRISADAYLLSAQEMLVDESLLSGESVPVRKIPGQNPPGDGAPASGKSSDQEESAHQPGGEDLPYVFSGSLVVRGQGMAQVTGTGPRSQLGRIGTAIGDIVSTPPRLTLETRRLVRVLVKAGLFISLLAILLYGILRGNWIQALLGGIAVSMSLLPEEFPLVLTVFMVMGAWRISQVRVLTRQAAAIEVLGSATVLCTDKTGTLTQNRMRVDALCVDGQIRQIHKADPTKLDDIYAPLVEGGLLASSPNPVDPMEVAIHELWQKTQTGRPHPSLGRRLAKTWGLQPTLLAVTQAWESLTDDQHVVAVKGAPEAVAALCHLDADKTATLNRDIDSLAAAGLRVLAVGRAASREKDWTKAQTDFDFTFIGLIGFADPLRLEVPAAVNECHEAGIKVVMVTGDYPATARSIAQQAGLATAQVIQGSEAEQLSDAALAERARDTRIFARIAPLQKLRIVRAFQANGEVVAMTGDGVNDAPSLKAADIGIAMGGRGTDVAREAASIVLLDDDFGSIVKTIRLGRRIYDNLRKASGFILAVHIPIAGLALLPLITGMPIILGPVHIAFLEMIIDPVCSLVFEAQAEEDDIMHRPPRPPSSLLFSRDLIIWSAVQGTLAFLVVSGVYILAWERGMAETSLRALTFTALVLCNIALILVNRSFHSSLWAAVWGRNVSLWTMLILTLSLLSLSILWAPAQHLFRFDAFQLDGLTVAVGAGFLVLIGLELLKFFWPGRRGSSVAGTR